VAKRDFLTLDDVTAAELLALLDGADAHKADRRPPAQGPQAQADPKAGSQARRDTLAGSTVALIFEKPSMRTRVSFAVAVRELGGDPLELADAEIGLGRRETIEDAAAVLSRYVHAIVLRTTGQERVERLARAAAVPVINALSDYAHPCQALADMQTIRAHTGRLAGVRLTYLGDGNNVAHSLLEAGAKLGLHVTVASPSGYEPIPQVVRSAAATAAATGGSVQVTNDPLAAVKDADVVYTDVWASMGAEDQAEARTLIFQPYQLGADLLAGAAPDAIVLHCLPAHRGDEITSDVLDGPHARVLDQAENRLHTAKALLSWLLTPQ
jgi:ornithine carbamoyltransferase